MSVRDNAAALEYEITVDGKPAGTIRYTLAGDVVTLVHTEVEPSYEGHGVAAELVKGALDDIRARGKKVRPVCEYVRAYLERHDEYRDLVQE